MGNASFEHRIPDSVSCLSDVLALPSVSNHVVYSGYLLKRGGHAHWSWKRRYFILKDLSVWYFRSDAPDAEALGLICLPSYWVQPDVDCNVSAGRFSFALYHNSARSYHFRANSLCDMTAWMNAMTRACLCLDELVGDLEWRISMGKLVDLNATQLPSNSSQHRKGYSAVIETAVIAEMSNREAPEIETHDDQKGKDEIMKRVRRYGVKLV
jgi:hypothetical protein